MSPQTPPLPRSDINPLFLTNDSPHSSSHIFNMSEPHRTPSTDSVDATRKRVCKACDRCRLKKSKCDGSSPCSRCKTDNAICVFGERKKSHDKVYPKGYVEMLEQQQEQLVSGLQEMYRRLWKGEPWNAPKLSETSGHPLTHDILAALGLLEMKHDGSGELETFEDDVEKIQSKLIAEGAGYVVRRRGSMSSDSEHSQHGQRRATTHAAMTSVKQPPLFNKNFTFSASPSPAAQSPAHRHHRLPHPPPHESPLHCSQPLTPDPQMFQPDWPAFPEPPNMLRSNYPPQLNPGLDQLNSLMAGGQWDDPTYDLTMGMHAYSQPQPFQYTVPHVNDYGMDLDSDFKQFIQVTT